MLKYNFAGVIIAGLLLPILGISRNDVITRAKFWSDTGVPYSQTAYSSDPSGTKYRTDCSGYVSMAWKLPENRTTRTLPKVIKSISKDELKSGDIILNIGVHVIIFDQWTSNENTRYWAYEETPPKTVYHQIDYPYRGRPGYSPYRFVDIEEDKIIQGPCKCPETTLDLAKHYSLAPLYCGHQLEGTCTDDLYICAYQNNVNNNEGRLTMFQSCANGCSVPPTKSTPPYQPHCRSEPMKAIGPLPNSNSKPDLRVGEVDNGPEWDSKNLDASNDAGDSNRVGTCQPAKILSAVLYGIILVGLHLTAQQTIRHQNVHTCSS